MLIVSAFLYNHCAQCLGDVY